MADEGPWQWYDRDRLPKGWAYTVARDEVAAALVDAGVTLGRLSFGSGTLKHGEPLYVLRLYWASDARPKYFQEKDIQPVPLMLFLNAVPSPLRLPIGQALRDTWPKQAARWAAQAPLRGNAWTASDHSWHLKQTSAAGFAVESA